MSSLKLKSLQAKIIILLLVLVFGSGLGALTYTTYSLQNKLRDEAQRYSIAITRMLAKMSAVSQSVVYDVETQLEKQMIAQAKISAHLVAAAEKAGESNQKIRQRLKDIVRDTELDEFWITDPTGLAYLTNVDGFNFRFLSDPKKQPQAHIFYDLLREDGPQYVTQEARVREIDNNIFKYVGTKGVDKNRIVQVGYDFAFMKELTDRVGLKRMIDTIIKDKRIHSIWVFDKKLQLMGHSSSVSPPPTTKEGDTPLSPSWDKDEIDLKEVLHSTRSLNTIKARFSADYLHVAAPIFGPDNKTIGATLIYFSTLALRDLINDTVIDALLLGVIALFFALLIAIVVGRKLSQPILALTTSVRALYCGSLELDHTSPFIKREDELGVFVREFRRMAKDIHQREEELDRLVKERTAALESTQQQIRQEMDMAGRFQMAILPTTFPQHKHFKAKGYMRAAKEMGGDFYDMFTIDKNQVGLVIADVSGKGVPAAFFMAVSRTELRNEAMSKKSPSTVLQNLNNKLCEENPLELFVTIFYAVLDHKQGTLTYANGGHNPPYILHPDNTLTIVPTTGDTVVGMVKDLKFKEASTKIKHKDILYLYTDGIPEAFDSQNEEFSNQRMKEVLLKGFPSSPSELIKRMLGSVNQHVGNAPQSDDITCLSVQFLELQR